jgi:hypothetical protein
MMTEQLSYKIDGMPPHARAWVYKASRPLNDSELEFCTKNLQAFIGEWSSHGASMKAGYTIMADRFLVLMADEDQAKASGCSIDSSVHFIQALGRELNIDFFDRMHVVINVADEFKEVNFNEIPNLLSQGLVTAETQVFDTLVANKADFDSRFQAPMKDTWLSRYL